MGLRRVFRSWMEGWKDRGGGKGKFGKKGQKVATYTGPESKEKELERGRGGRERDREG